MSSGPLGLALPGATIHQHQVTTVTVVEWDHRPLLPPHEGYNEDGWRERATKLALSCPCGWLNIVDVKLEGPAPQ